MKNKLLFTISIVFAFTCAYGQDTIPNRNFENWITNYHPKNWETTNLLLPAGVNNCYRSTNSYTGAYALHLESIDLNGQIVPGVATLGTLEVFNSKGGIPFTSKPIALRGFFQHSSTGDEILIGIEFFKDGVEIGDGVWTTTDSVSDYTEFIIPISFYSNQNPDTMNITLLTDQIKEGSSVFIDALEFEYELTSVSGNYPDESKLRCFPNPSNGLITLDTDHLQNAVIIYDLRGRSVKKVVPSAKLTKIDLRKLSPGIYTIACHSDNKVSFQKLIIQ
ncbi:MAG: T9SS type A sorting domain-containing protein [Bacteroidales bacterium]|nr:T9SS type A sorting domain-containing protein [Bacteroidales bacterium]